MFIPFSSLPPSSRVWIFQGSRPMAAEESKLVEDRLREFTENWTVHGSPLNTSFTIKYNQFIILAADETNESASGCSIDSSVRVLKELEQALDIDFFDRSQVPFKIGDQIQLVPVQELKQKFQDGILEGETFTLNNLVSTKSAFEQGWLTPAAKTWLNRYLPKESVKAT